MAGGAGSRVSYRQASYKRRAPDGKGALLEEIFGRHDVIADSDEGKSFRAFWDVLMSPSRRDELSMLLTRVMALEQVRELAPDARLQRIHHDWLEVPRALQGRSQVSLGVLLEEYPLEQGLAELAPI